jgi:hypothetical protein
LFPKFTHVFAPHRQGSHARVRRRRALGRGRQAHATVQNRLRGRRLARRAKGGQEAATVHCARRVRCCCCAGGRQIGDLCRAVGHVGGVVCCGQVFSSLVKSRRCSETKQKCFTPAFVSVAPLVAMSPLSLCSRSAPLTALPHTLPLSTAHHYTIPIQTVLEPHSKCDHSTPLLLLVLVLVCSSSIPLRLAVVAVVELQMSPRRQLAQLPLPPRCAACVVCHCACHCAPWRG